VARAQLVYADSLLEDDEVEDASTRIESARAILGPAARPRERAWLAWLSGHVALRRGEYQAAVEQAREAIGTGQSDDPELLGRAEITLGEALWRLGDAAGALSAFERAEALLAAGEPRFLLALLHVWSEVLEAEGRLAEALQVLRRAADISAAGGATGRRTQLAGGESFRRAASAP
jgi:tetratricopeptide (TPR) repeat protein